MDPMDDGLDEAMSLNDEFYPDLEDMLADLVDELDSELIALLKGPVERKLPFELEYATDPDIGVRCEWTGTLFTPSG